jgi:hypothetical protein
MSNLRIIGLLIGITGLLLTFFSYRGPKWKRSTFILFSFCNLFLILFSLKPDILNLLRDALSLTEVTRGRILALLILSNFFLFYILFMTKSKLEKMLIQFDKLVRYLGRNRDEEDISELENVREIMVLIPAYNEADNLRELLPEIPDRINEQDLGVLIIDDGSEDETFKIADSAKNTIAVKNPVNRGGGAALRLGYDILKKAGVKICVTMDADGQHVPQEIKSLVYPIIENKYDFVIGSRILGKRERGNRLRIAGVFIFGRLISFLLGKKITDPSSGFRAFRIDVMDSVRLLEDQYHTSELIIEAVKNGLRITEVPITILNRRHGRSKKGNDLAYGLNFVRIIIKTWWR